MTSFHNDCIKPFRVVDFIRNEKGYIVWRIGTGHNVELLHIRASKKGVGYGRELVQQMVKRLKKHKPYHSVFGFARKHNAGFYRKIGFHIETIPGIYKEGSCVIFYQEYKKLCTPSIK